MAVPVIGQQELSLRRRPKAWERGYFKLILLVCFFGGIIAFVRANQFQQFVDDGGKEDDDAASTTNNGNEDIVNSQDASVQDTTLERTNQVNAADTYQGEIETTADRAKNKITWPLGKKSACVDKHPITLPTELTEEQKKLLRHHAIGKKSYLEWGAGGSSDVVSRFVDGPAFSIDNHPTWCAKVQQNPYVKCRVAEGSMTFQCVDTGPVKLYGNPENPEDIPKFANYVRANEAFGLNVFDFILDDGRSRCAVAFQAFKYMDENSILVIHDYPEDPSNERYANYHRVEEYFERIDAGGSKAAILRKRMDSKGPPPDIFEKELLNYH